MDTTEVDTPFAVQHQAPMVQKVQMTHDAPQLQFVDELVRFPVVAQRQISMVENIWETVGTHQIRQVPTITKERRRWSQTEIDRMVQEAEKYGNEDELSRRRLRPRITWRITALLRQTLLVRRSSCSSLKLDKKRRQMKLCRMLWTGWTSFVDAEKTARHLSKRTENSRGAACAIHRQTGGRSHGHAKRRYSTVQDAQHHMRHSGK